MAFDHLRREAAPLNSDPSTEFRVSVVDGDQLFRTRLALDLGQHVPADAYTSVEEMEDRVPPGTPMVVLLGPTMAEVGALSAIERVGRTRPEVGPILIVETLTTEVLQRALRSGVRDVLSHPLDNDQLLSAIDRVATSLASFVPQRPATGAEPVSGKVITVFSTKGGAGKSVIACNLAVLLARRSSKPVVLVDADLQFGDVAVMLKLAPQHTIVDAVNAMDRLDAQLLSNLLARHDASGLQVLPAPLEPAFADQIGSGQMLRILELLRESAEYIVVDTPAYFNDVVLGLIEASDEVLLVAGMDIPNIKNVKIGLQTLRLLNIPLTKLKLILNRANSKVKLDVGEVERTLGIKADCLVPSDVVVPQSVNKGIPCVLDAPKSGVTRSMEELADLFVPSTGKRKR